MAPGRKKGSKSVSSVRKGRKQTLERRDCNWYYYDQRWDEIPLAERTALKDGKHQDQSSSVKKGKRGRPKKTSKDSKAVTMIPFQGSSERAYDTRSRAHSIPRRQEIHPPPVPTELVETQSPESGCVVPTLNMDKNQTGATMDSSMTTPAPPPITNPEMTQSTDAQTAPTATPATVMDVPAPFVPEYEPISPASQDCNEPSTFPFDVNHAGPVPIENTHWIQNDYPLQETFMDQSSPSSEMKSSWFSLLSERFPQFKDDLLFSMGDYKHRFQCCNISVCWNLCRVFNGYPQVMEAFNQFICGPPPTVNDNPPSPVMLDVAPSAAADVPCDLNNQSQNLTDNVSVNSGSRIDELVDFLKKVKERFAQRQRSDNYKEFVDILSRLDAMNKAATNESEFRVGQFEDRQNLYGRLLIIFQDEPDLQHKLEELAFSGIGLGVGHQDVTSIIDKATRSVPDVRAQGNEFIHVENEDINRKESGQESFSDSDIEIIEEVIRTKPQSEEHTSTSDPELRSASTVPLQLRQPSPDLKCYESLTYDFIRIDRCVLFKRMRSHENLFELNIDWDNVSNERSIEEKITEIIQKDFDECKWQIRLIKVLLGVLRRVPKFARLIRKIFCLSGEAEKFMRELLRKEEHVNPSPWVASNGNGAFSRGASDLGTNRLDCSRFYGSTSYYYWVGQKPAALSEGKPKSKEELVLNTEYFSQTQTQFFEIPFRSKKDLLRDLFEDAIFEVDIMVEKHESLTKALEEVHKKLATMEQDTLNHFELNESFDGEGLKLLFPGKRVTNGLQKFPSYFVPPVLMKVKEILGQWARAKREWKQLVKSGTEIRF